MASGLGRRDTGGRLVARIVDWGGPMNGVVHTGRWAIEADGVLDVFNDGHVG